MTFKEALAHVVDTDSHENFCNAFYLYSALSDLCGCSYTEKQKVGLFFKIDKRLGVVENLFYEGKIAIPILKAAYPIVQKHMSLRSYIGMIDCATKAMNLDSIDEEIDANDESGASSENNYTETNDLNRQSEQNPSKSTPIVLTTASLIKIAAICFCILAVVIPVICLIIFRSSVSWLGWQFVIGIFGDAILSAVGGSVAYVLDGKRKYYKISYKILFFVVLFIAVVNGALLLTFGVDCKVIFIFLSAYSLLASAISVYLAFSDLNDEWGAASLLEALAVAVALILGVIL